jgi:hypothetical protein
MQCHYCDRDAAIAVEQDAVRVGVCGEHFRERVEALSENGVFDGLKDELDVDS